MLWIQLSCSVSPPARVDCQGGKLRREQVLRPLKSLNEFTTEYIEVIEVLCQFICSISLSKDLNFIFRILHFTLIMKGIVEIQKVKYEMKNVNILVH